jgi:hypothetical protein
MMPTPQAPSGVTDLSPNVPRVNDKRALQQYADAVIENSQGTITGVSWVGGNAILYEFGMDHENRDEGEMEELLTQVIENHTSIDTDAYENFYKVGDRYFALKFGAGASIVEVTEWFKKHVPIVKPLASGETAMESEIQNICRLAGITEEEESGLSRGAQMIVQHTLDAVQDLDEMGGVTSLSDYVRAMETLIAELTKRRDVAADRINTEGDQHF